MLAGMYVTMHWLAFPFLYLQDMWVHPLCIHSGLLLLVLCTEHADMRLLPMQIVYFYVSSMLTQWRQWSSIFMYCAAWFLIGFVQCRRLGQFYV